VILGVLATLLQPIPIHYRWRPQLQDPNDELVLECAINAQARAIITFNIRDFLPAANQFQLELIQRKDMGLSFLESSVMPIATLLIRVSFQPNNEVIDRIEL
jgi:predicted nucleic acid-binding protein